MYIKCRTGIIESLMKVLQVEETNVKALYRITLAHEKKGSLEEAWKYIGLAR